MKISVIAVLFAVCILLASALFAEDNEPENSQENATKPTVTFIELGSDRCIPCKQMKPVMAEIESKFEGQVEVIFYDVWTKEHKHYAEEYQVRLIPTQIFLDEDGSEFFRHEGFFATDEIVKLFADRGIAPKEKK